MISRGWRDSSVVEHLSYSGDVSYPSPSSITTWEAMYWAEENCLRIRGQSFGQG